MKNIVMGLSGLILTAAFACIFYMTQDKSHGASVEKKDSAKKENSGSATLEEVSQFVESAKSEIAKINARTLAISVEAQALKERKKELEEKMDASADLLEVFTNQGSLPSEGASRQDLMKVASTIIGLKEDGEKVFAKIARNDDKTLLYIEGKSLFRHSQPSQLRTSQVGKLDTLVEQLPENLKLKKVTVYQAYNSNSSVAANQLKSVEELLSKKYGKYVEEIQVRMTKKDLIPNHSDFLVEMGLAEGGHHTEASRAPATPKVAEKAAEVEDER